MKKLISGLIGLIIFIGVGATGTGFYVNNKSAELAEQSIAMLKDSGFDLSQYESLEIDYFEQSLSLKNLTIASSQQTWFKLSIGEVKLDGINPVKDLALFIKKTQLTDIELSYHTQNYKITDIVADGLMTGYQPHFERILAAQNLADKIRTFHEEVDYEAIAFNEFELSDRLGNVSHIADGSYGKQSLINNLPSQWRVHLTGMQISPAHLPADYAQLLKDYQLKELNGILDVSFDYQKDSHTALFAINNLNFGGLANLQSDILISMTDERFLSLYNLNDLDEKLNILPIEHAEIIYNDYGLYNYFIGQQAPKMQLSEAELKAQIYFGLALASAQITDLERRVELTQPFTDFIAKPAGLRIELSPAKPVRFQQYLNVYDANVLVRDLNPSIKYLSK